MSVTPPPSITPAPTPAPQRGDRTTFKDRVDAFITWLIAAVAQFLAIAENVYDNAVEAFSSAQSAAEDAAAAAAAAAEASAAAGVTKWISGTNYQEGDNVWSPISFRTYRRKAAGGGAVDPSLDTANWAVVGFSGISTITDPITADVALTAAYSYVPVQMAGLGRSVTLPSALSLAPGGPLFIIDNTKGEYPAGIRDNEGGLLMAVAPGGEALVSLREGSTQAGTWSITGSRLEPGLITVDASLSNATYAFYPQNKYLQCAALDDHTSIHFAPLAAGGFAAFVVDNVGGVASTPVAVDTTASSEPLAAFRIDATRAILFYGVPGTTNTHKAVVLSLTGASPTLSLIVGTPVTSATPLNGGWGGEDSLGAPRIAQLTPTLYVCAARASGAADAKAFAIEVAGAVITIGAAVSILASSGVHTAIYALTATTALVIGTTSAVSYNLRAAVVSVVGNVCTAGVEAIGQPNTAAINTGGVATCLLSPTRAMALTDLNSAGNLYAQPLTINGTTVTWGAVAGFTAGTTTTIAQNYDGAHRYKPHVARLSDTAALVWAVQNDGVSIAAIVRDVAGVWTMGARVYKSFCEATSTSFAGHGQLAAIGSDTALVLKQQAASPLFSLIAVALKTDGATGDITMGAGVPLREVAQEAASLHRVTRLASGDCVLIPGSSYSESTIPVLRAYGSGVQYRGNVSCPLMLTWTHLQGVSTNRLVLLGRTTAHVPGASTPGYVNRVISLEIAK